MEFLGYATVVDIDKGLRSSEYMRIYLYYLYKQLHLVQKFQRLGWPTMSHMSTRGLTRAPLVRWPDGMRWF